MSILKNNLYIHQQNQQILWNTICKTPLIEYIPFQYREQWFKSIVQLFYEKNKQVTDPNVVQGMNKETIQYMINELKRIKTQIQQPQPQTQIQQPQPQTQQSSNTMYMGKNELLERKQQFANQAFTERQKEYERMFEKPVAPEVNFKEKLDDEPIGNIEELVEKHRREREYELQQFSPPKLKIENDLSDVIVHVENEKKVKWSDDTLQYNELKSMINDLKIEIMKLKMEVETIKTENQSQNTNV